MKNKLVNNYIYNLAFQVTNLLIPLVTVPYLSRVLGAEGVGTFSYFYSIASIFALFIILGLTNYGNRSIAQCLEDRQELSKTFSELFYMQSSLGFIVILIYSIFSFLTDPSRYSLLLVPLLLGSMLDVNWYLYGREKFKATSTIGIAIKLLTTISFFIFIKSKDDVPLYILLMAISTLMTQLVAFPLVLKEVRFVKVTFRDIIKHIEPNLILFIPVVAVSIYRTMDKVILGSMTEMTEVGYFENGEKIISVLVGVVASLGTVMLPRMTSLYAERNKEAIKSLMNKSIVFVALISSVITFGVLAISEELVVCFLGEGFRGSTPILALLCVTVPFISFANVIRTQILIPRNNDKPFVISSVIGAIINLIANMLLIRFLGGRGSAIATILAEVSVFVVQYIYAKKDMNFKDIKGTIAIVYFIGLIMLGVVFIIKYFLQFSTFVNMIIEIVAGTLVFGGLLLLATFVMRDKNLLSISKLLIKR